MEAEAVIPADMRPLRVLIVDDEAEVREGHEKNLRFWGYEPYFAEGMQAALIESAKDQARTHRCHLALVDLRLKDHTDDEDKSGLSLIDTLRPAKSILVTGFGYRRIPAEAILNGAVDFAAKQDGPRALREVVDHAARKLCENWGLEVVWPLGFGPREILDRFAADDPKHPERWAGAPEDELRLIMKQLFEPPVARVLLEPLDHLYQLPDSTISHRRSVVLYARPTADNGNQFLCEVVKLAPVEQVKAEHANYLRHVLPHLDKNRSARIEHPPVLRWDVGTIRYSNEAAERSRLLTTWYRDMECQGDVIARALRDLVGATLAPWHRLDSPRSEGNVFEYYTALVSHLAERLQAYPIRTDRLAITGLARKYLNPVNWAVQHRQQPVFHTRWQAITHGDLHSRNVFVNGNGQTAVIDYERTGPGHMLRDAVELEKDIKLGLLRIGGGDLRLAEHLDRLLLAPRDTGDRPVWAEPDNCQDRARDELKQAFDAICSLRQTYAEQLHLERMDEYYWALLMETLVSVTADYSGWADEAAADLAQDRATLSASLICERLARWDEVGARWLQR